MSRRLLTAVAVAACAASVLSACSPDTVGGHGEQSARTGLQQALGRIAADRSTVRRVFFSRPAAITALLPTDRRKHLFSPYYNLRYQGGGTFASVYEPQPATLGVDLAEARYVYTAGEAPHRVGAVVDVDTAQLRRTLRPLATAVRTVRGATTFRLRPDDEFVHGDALARALPRLGQESDFNVVRATDSQFRYASSTADVDLGDADGSTLLDAAPVAAVAGCLGNPLAAMLTDELPRYRPYLTNPPPRTLPPRPAPSAGVTHLGIGVTAGARLPLERLCVALDTTAHAHTLAAAVERALATGRDAGGERWSDDVTSSRVRVTGSTVSVSLTFHDGPARQLLSHYLDGDLPGVVG